MAKSGDVNLGSEWRKWDLHVHSPASFNYKGSYEDFENQIKISDCNVIGINDYFSVEGYKYIKRKIDSGEIEIGNRKILPIVEFRMSDAILSKHSNQNSTHFNFHVIFNDAIKVEDIESLICGLECNGSIIGSDYSDKEKLKEKVVSFPALLEKLKNDQKFKDNYLVWLPYDEHGGIDDIDPISNSWIKGNYIKNSDILGSANKKQIDFFLWISDILEDGTPKYPQQKFYEWFLKRKPCIKGSDSHSYDYPIGKLRDSTSNPSQRYCWIKADLTFEGLKQIIHEPATRLFIGEQKPRSPVNTINSIILNIPNDAQAGSDKFCFAGKNATIHLSPYFNCFIGGRGSGKSTILNLLGLYSTNSEPSKEFWDGSSSEKSKNKINRGLCANFDPRSQDVFKFEGTKNFEFLAQSEIESFARDKEKFTEAIYKRAHNIKVEKYENVTELSRKEIEEVLIAIKLLQDLNDKKSAKAKEKKSLEESLKVITSEEYRKFNHDISENSKKLQILIESRQRVSNLKNSLSNLKNSNNLVNISNAYDNSFKQAQEKLEEAILLIESSSFDEEVEVEKKLKEKIGELESSSKILLEKVGYTSDNLEQIKSAPQKIAILENQINEISSEIKLKDEIISKYDGIIAELKNAKVEYEAEITNILKPLQKTLKDQYDANSGSNIKQISLEYSFDLDRAWDTILDSFYNEFRVKFGASQKSTDVSNFIIEGKNIFMTDDLEMIRDYISNHVKSKNQSVRFLDEVFKDINNFKIFKAIRDRHLNDVKAYKIIHVKYDNKALELASFGQRCTAVVVLLLLFGNYPLIIDEPEAHLDSSLIANYLVPLLKEKKFDRQIIFATHNANFVINGDAEKIFILKNDEGETHIIETTIEDVNNRNELMKLEGSKDAFQSRGEKLNIL